MRKIANQNSFLKKIKTLFTCDSSDSIKQSKLLSIDNSSANDDHEISETNNLNLSSIPDYEFLDTPTNEKEVSNEVSSEENLSNTVSYSDVTIQSTPTPCVRLLGSRGNYYTTGKRHLLFKVDKSKFSYPVPKSTDLYYYPNLPIIQSLETTESIKNMSNTTDITCSSKKVSVPIILEYKEINFKPFVSYSVALYEQKPTTTPPINDPFNINNLDIYSLENDALFLTPFQMCFNKNVPKFTPNQFLVEVTVVSPLGGKVSPTCEFEDYYLYELEVEITLSLAPDVNLSSINQDTLAVLNKKLNKPLNNTIFTVLELASVTEINYANVTNLDYNIFKYLTSLIDLDISNTNAQTNPNFNQLNNLTSLQNLIARDNNFTNLTPFLSLTNLFASLKTIDFGLETTTLFSFDLTQNACLDITPLTNFIGLTGLSLANNLICSLPDTIGNFSNLNTLNIAGTGLIDFSNLSLLGNLTQLNISSNNLNTLPESVLTLGNLTSLKLDNNNISDLTSLSQLTSLKTLSIEGNPIDPTKIGNIPNLEFLDLTSTNLTTEKLLELTIPSSLKTLVISKNAIYDISNLEKYSINVIAKDQLIDYGNISPIEIDSSEPSYTFVLELDFLKDLNGDDPCIDTISEPGKCYTEESCNCQSIIWENVSSTTPADLTFSTFDDNFTGTITLLLVTPIID
ncbi:leucine-rich repeat domain-containing protein [Romboutsia lituseburensis]|uniref:leucine-rich repeat domain-containing protein n=1 Tax=Romboutsia lituseburensis TaxID=1537 RepID=UPI00215A787C|nr:hypothetical protein [Romboutsia lituseburensis]MCR8744700.1 hypothetical protein [Romboutsia lituseburensis]